MVDGLGRELILWVHETSTSSADALLNHELLPNFDHATCVLEISTKASCLGNSPRLGPKNTSLLPKRLVVTPAEPSPEVRKKTPNLQLSLLSHLATTFGISPRSVVTVEAVPKSAHVADYMVLYFKDQYISRSDMWRAACNLEGQCIYVGKRITFTGGIRADVREIWRGGQKTFSAYVSANTKPVFRSESARYLIFIQMSKEMWEFEEDGELFYNKAIDGFLPELFKKWKSMNAHHLVSIVLFTRVFYQGAVGPFCLPRGVNSNDMEIGNVDGDVTKAFHNDFYKIVVDNVSSNHWESTLTELKRELHGFARDVLLQKRKFRSDEHAEAPLGTISSAMEGNVLEAINLAAHQFNRDYIDRDLLRTGTSMLFVTAGTGVFEVNERLLKLTGECLLGNGIGMDIVCLSRRPLHVVPLFKYIKAHEDRSSKTFEYVLPYICEISYYGESSDANMNDTVFQPRLKMHELQMQGRKDHSLDAVTIPRLNDHIVFKSRELAHLSTGLDTRLDLYDELCFSSKDHSTKITKTIQKDQLTAEVPGEEVIQLLGTSLPSSGEKTTFKSLYELSKANNSVGNDINFPYSRDSRASASSANLSGSFENGRYPSNSPVEMKGQSPSKSRSTFSRLINKLADKADSVQGLAQHASDLTKSRIGQSSVHLPPVLMSMKSLKAKPSIASMTEEVTTPSTLIQPRRNGRLSSTSPKSSAMLQESKAAGARRAEDQKTTAIPIHANDDGSGLTQQKISSSRKILTSIDLQEARAQSVSQTLTGHTATRRPSPRSRSNLQVKYKPERSEAPDASPWHILVNPSYPSKNSSTMNAKAWRWAHVSDRARRSGDMNWESMCAPAALPLTTTTIIDLEELKSSKYSENSYSIWIDLVDQPLTQKELLREMIGQRLVQGYQLAQTPINAHRRSLTSDDIHDRSNRRQPLHRGPLGDMGETIYLSHAQMEVHCITCDASREMIEVTRYVRTREVPKPIGYSSLIWQLAQDDGYDDSVVVFRPLPTDHSWNYVDQIICGVARRFTDAVRFWRARFLLIPNDSRDKRNPPPIAGGTEQFTEEEVKVAGVNKICELLEKSVYLPPKELARENKGAKKLPQVAVTFTTLAPSAYTAHEYEHFSSKSEESSRTTEHKSKTFISSEMSLEDYAREMQSVKGITIKDRLWHWRWHESSWVGSEFVSWLIERSELQDRDVAARVAQTLMEKGLFEHVQNKHAFLDGFYLYRLKSDYVTKTPKSWFGSRKVTPVTAPAPPPLRHRAISNVSSLSPNSPVTRPMKDKTKFELSHWIRVDIDPHRKSHRPEFVSLHYDNVHNPETCFHIRLEWIAVTAKLVEEMVQQWSRISEKYGLTLVEAPVDEAFAVTASNPFRAPLVIELCLEPPAPKANADGVVPSRSGEREKWLTKVLKYWNFVLDQEAATKFPRDLDVTYSWGRPSYRYTQFIHRSGMSLCQITPTGFLWLTNRLYVSRVSGAAPMVSLPSPVRINSTMSASEPDNIRNAFRQWCHDPEKLRQFYEQGLDSEQTFHMVDERGSFRGRPIRKSSSDDRSSVLSIALSQ